MSLSPQQLQELLETSKRLKKPALSVVSSPKPEPLATPPAMPQPQALAPEPRPSPQPLAPTAPTPIAPNPEPPAGTVPEDFSSFSGLPKRQPSLPRGAKNVKCHTVERDPDTGKISRVYTYDLEEEPHSGDQISRQPEEQRSGSD